MKTKAQKKQQVAEGVEKIGGSKTLVVTDFTGLTANDMNAYRKALRAIGTPLRVMKKRLLRIALKEQGIEFDTDQFPGQMGVAFSPADSLEVSGVVYRFSKPFEKAGSFKILGGYNLEDKSFITSDDMKRLGQLPSREVLLGQLVGMIASPIRSFLFVLDQKAKKSN